VLAAEVAGNYVGGDTVHPIELHGDLVEPLSPSSDENEIGTTGSQFTRTCSSDP
jgi:hypothetical protein